MKRRLYKYKRQLFLWLSAILLLSGVQTKAASVYGRAGSFHSSPHTPAVQRSVSWLYHDVSTEESLGTRSVRSILDYCTRSPGRGFCRMPDTIYQVSKSDLFSYPPALAAKLHQQTREPYTIPWIICYIHDQDGEKDRVRPLI